jgi:hypothetical protein
MRFICCFCNGNGRAAVGEYQSQYPVHKTSDNISTYIEFQGTIVPSNQQMQIINTRDKSIFWNWCHKPKTKHRDILKNP